MQRIHCATASAILILSCLPAVQGAPKQRSDSPAGDARTTLEDIQQLSSIVSETAFELNRLAKVGDPESHLDRLETVKTDVNRIGTELQALNVQRGSLSPWETKALEQTIPLMSQVAQDAQQAIAAFKDNRHQLFANGYADDVAKIDQEAHNVATILHDYLKLAGDREEEQRIEQNLTSTP